MQTESVGQYFRGGRIAGVPNGPGIYAWYYKPAVPDWPAVAGQLTRLLDTNVQIETKASLRYGLQLRSVSSARVHYQADRRDLTEVINELDGVEREAVVRFITTEAFLTFSRPLYIGIARALNQRVYDQHYSDLVRYWDDAHEVSRYLRAEPSATVEHVTAALGLKRSFALEARTRGIAPRDLIVYVHQTTEFVEALETDGEKDEGEVRRSLERVLHLLADPICGKR